VPEYFLVVLQNGRAEVVDVPNGESPNDVAKNYYLLDSFLVRAEAQERCHVENDPIKRELLMSGKLKVHKTG
jgi:hypothetical protein